MIGLETETKILCNWSVCVELCVAVLVHLLEDETLCYNRVTILRCRAAKKLEMEIGLC